MPTEPLTLRVDTDLLERIETAADSAGISRSQLCRNALTRGLESLSDVPDDLAETAKRQRLKSEHQTERRKGWFRSNFSDGMKRAFRDGLSPDEFRASVRPYIEEAGTLGKLPADVTDATGADTYTEWVAEMLDYYAAAYDASHVDAEAGVNAPLEGFEGVDTGREWAARRRTIADATGQKQRRLASQAVQDGIVPDTVLDAEHLGRDETSRVCNHAETADSATDTANQPMTDTTDTMTQAQTQDKATDGGRGTTRPCRECDHSTRHTDAESRPLCPVCMEADR